MARAAISARAWLRVMIGLGLAAGAGISACSSESGDGGEEARTRTALAPSLGASQRIAELRSAHQARLVLDPESLGTPRTELRPAIPEGSATGFELDARDPSSVHPVLPADLTRTAVLPARVVLPRLASAPIRLLDQKSGTEISFSLQGARPVEIEVASGLALYPAATHDGRDVVQRVTEHGVEDYVVYVERPAEEAVRYDVDLGGVEGLRLVGNVLEMVRGGTPVLRVAPPYIIGADRRRHIAGLEVEGCAYDTSDPDPHRSGLLSVPPPGSRTCTVLVKWAPGQRPGCARKDGSDDCAAVAYPAVLDPYWSTPVNMSYQRMYFATVTNQFTSTEVYAIGGNTGSGAIPYVEYTSNGQTWTSFTQMKTAREGHVAAGTPQLRLFVAGGVGLNTWEYYAGAGWNNPVAFADGTVRRDAAAVKLSDGQVLVAGGCCPLLQTSWLFTEPGTITAGPTLTKPKGAHTLTRLADNRILAAGGLVGTTTFVGDNTVELYTNGQASFTAVAATLPAATFRHKAALLDNGQVLITGGATDITSTRTVHTFATRFNPATNPPSFLATAAMDTKRELHVLFPVAGARAVVAGGRSSDTAFLNTARIYSAAANTWTPFDNLSVARSQAEAAEVFGVVMGGTSGGTTVHKTSERLTLTADGQACPTGGAVLCARGNCVNGVCCFSPSCSTGYTCAPGGTCKLVNGQVCSATNDCASGYCKDSRCCNTDCTTACRTCITGTCSNVVNADDNPECTGANTCNASAACKKKNGQSCSVGTDCVSTYCVNSVCCSTSSCATGYTCAPGGTCKKVNGQSCSFGTDCASTYCVNSVCCNTSSCTTGYTCAPQGTCKLANGQGCSSSGACASNQCVNNVCCTTSSCGTGQICTSPAGTCKKVSGQTCGTGTECASGWCVNSVCCASSGCTTGQVCAAPSGTCKKANGQTCALGTECASGQCVDLVCCNAPSCLNGQTCAPSGSCKKVNGQTCGGGTECVSGQCVNTVCCASSSCASGQVCAAPTGTCKQINGQTCALGSECASTYCTNLVCCNSPSCPSGESCAPSGICKKPNGLDCSLGSECASGFCVSSVCCGVSSCPAGQACAAGTGTCKNATGQSCATGADCASSYCVNSTCCGTSSCLAGYTCAPSGTCKKVNGQLCAAGSECATGFCVNNVCCAASSCSAGQTCAPGGTCKKSNGQTCAAASECASTYCVDGTCCDSTCTEQCMACSADLKQDAKADGVCNFAKTGTDPRSSCVPGALECSEDGECDGSGNCRLAVFGTSCSTGASCLGSFAKGQICDGGGVCIDDSTGIDCAPFACKTGTGCTNPCTSDADCVTGHFCDAAGSCEPTTGLGEPCAADNECQSGICLAEGFCCDLACDGPCETCDKAGAIGKCQPIVGSPPPSKPACPGPTATNPCSGRVCDGTVGASCAGYVTGITCAEAKCEAGVATSAAKCDGKGSCETPQTVDCGAYVCDATTCKQSCATDEDCAGGNKCDVASQKCVSGSSCKGPSTVVDPLGGETDCSPYACAGGRCKESCGSSADCVAGNVCDPSSSRCVDAEADAVAEEEGGCGCRTPGGPTHHAPLLSLFGLALLLASTSVRRKRRRRA
jgi:hypothetical protein